MVHNRFKRWLRPWPTHCNWSIWERVTQPLAEIATLIVLYVELRPRCNESNLSPLLPAGDGAAQGPSQLCNTSIMIAVLPPSEVYEIVSKLLVLPGSGPMSHRRSVSAVTERMQRASLMELHNAAKMYLCSSCMKMKLPCWLGKKDVCFCLMQKSPPQFVWFYL